MNAVQFYFSLFYKKMKPPRNLNIISTICTIKNHFQDSEMRNLPCRTQNLQKRLQSRGEGYEVDDSETFLMNDQFEHYQFARHLLFKNSTDEIMVKLNECASVEDVMNILDKYENVFTPDHMTQTILVLTDLQNGFYYFNGFRKKSLQDFIGKLESSDGFKKLLNLIRTNLDVFTVDLLSDIFLFIHKLGISPESDLMQKIGMKLCTNLKNDFRLDICAKFLTVIFKENSIRPYYISLELLPQIIAAIGKSLFISLYISVLNCCYTFSS